MPFPGIAVNSEGSIIDKFLDLQIEDNIFPKGCSDLDSADPA